MAISPKKDSYLQKDHSPNNASIPGYQAPIDNWEERIVNRFSLVLFFILMVALATIIPQAFETGFLATHYVLIGSTPFISAAAFLRHLSNQWRFVLSSYSILVVILVGIATTGFHGPNYFVAAMMIYIWSALLLKPKAALRFAFFGCFLLVCMSFMYLNTSEHPYNPVANLDNPINWVRVVAVYSSCVIGSVWCIQYVTARLQGGIVERERLIDALLEEHQLRIEELERSAALEQQLRQLQKLDALGSLTSGIAHDFNNLLMVIANSTDELKIVSNESARASLFEDVDRATDRASELTKRLLSYSRKEAAEKSLISVAPLVESSCQMLARLLPRQISIKTNIETSLGTIRSSATDIDQILMNLCVNARDAMPHGGELEISAQLSQLSIFDQMRTETIFTHSIIAPSLIAPQSEATKLRTSESEQLSKVHRESLSEEAAELKTEMSHFESEMNPTKTASQLQQLESQSNTQYLLQLSVKDNGIGMSPSTLRKAFEPFYTTKAEGTGTGLGLSLICGIVLDLGGGILVNTAINRGTQFIIALPVNIDNHSQNDAA